MISLEPLKTFLEAATQGSFRRAARARFVTISAVSQQVKNLETQLGVQLFERLGRRVRLTDEGRQLAAALRPAFTSIDDALDALGHKATELRGVVRVGTPRAFCAAWVRPRLHRLLERHAGLSLQLSFDVPSSLERAVSEGALDAAILGRPARLSTLVTRVVATERFVAVAAPSLLARQGIPRDAAAFAAFPFAVYDPDLAMHDPWWRAHFGVPAPKPARLVAQIPSLDELRALAEAGLAGCVLPEYHVRVALRAKRLRVLEPKAPRGRRVAVENELHLAVRAGAATTARFQALSAALT